MPDQITELFCFVAVDERDGSERLIATTKAEYVEQVKASADEAVSKREIAGYRILKFTNRVDLTSEYTEPMET